MGLFQKIRVKQRVATASKVQMFNIAKNEIVYQFHYKIAKLTEGYQIPQSAILNSGQLPQSTSLWENNNITQKHKVFTLASSTD